MFSAGVQQQTVGLACIRMSSSEKLLSALLLTVLGNAIYPEKPTAEYPRMISRTAAMMTDIIPIIFLVRGRGAKTGDRAAKCEGR